MTYDPKIEQELVHRLVKGDEEAFCRLYAIYRKRLIYFTMKFVKSADFAEDIFQEAFVAVWHSRQFIDPEKSFRSYIYTIVRNRILNLIRDIDNEARAKAGMSNLSAQQTDSADEHMALHELESLIASGKKSLTPRQRQIFEMSREQGMTNEEIAKNLGLSVNTVNDHISDSLRTLREYLEKSSKFGTCIDLILILSMFT